MLFLLSVSLTGAHYLKKLRITFINESIFAAIVGLIAGGILALTSNRLYIDSITNGYVKFFLIILLPPIIFESGYNLQIKEFFKNLGTILVYAIFGTVISILIIGFSLYFYSYLDSQELS